jgi:hypothetical protein
MQQPPPDYPIVPVKTLFLKIENVCGSDDQIRRRQQKRILLHLSADFGKINRSEKEIWPEHLPETTGARDGI